MGVTYSERRDSPVSAFLCFSGINICHRDSETQNCGIPSEKRKIQNETLPKKKAAGKSELRLFFYKLSHEYMSVNLDSQEI